MGVALAADSAVTIGFAATKIYGSAEKIFQLSNRYPVGIMIYGSDAYQGLSWETVIKVYRAQLGDRCFPTIEQYAKDFMEFIKSKNELFQDNSREYASRRLMSLLAHSLLERIRNKIEEITENEGSISDSRLASVVQDLTRSLLDEIRLSPEIDGCSLDLAEQVRNEIKTRHPNLIQSFFGTLPFDESTVSMVVDCFAEMLIRRHFGECVSGIVVAGFGEAQYFPAVHAIIVEEAVHGIPRWAPNTSKVISVENPSEILPFAQTETVLQFLDGIDPELRKEMFAASVQIFSDFADTIFDEVGASNPELAASMKDKVLGELPGIMTNLYFRWMSSGVNQSTDILSVVRNLPKDELASTAEALVNLTKFRRRVTPTRETVGGPIDVAVITKGDGFVWIRRKHYFDPALNPRVISTLQSFGCPRHD